MTLSDKNKECCRLLKIEWHENRMVNNTTIHCSCDSSKVYHCDPRATNIPIHNNPNFTPPSGRVQLLEIMENKGKLDDLIESICPTINLNFTAATIRAYILDLPDKPNFNDKLLDAAIAFLDRK